MDIDNLITNIKSRLDYHQCKLVLGDKWQPQLIFTYGEGTWRADGELISFLNTVMCRQQSIVLLDYHGNPVRVSNPAELLSHALEIYNNVMDGWYQDYIKINRGMS